MLSSVLDELESLEKYDLDLRLSHIFYIKYPTLTKYKL